MYMTSEAEIVIKTPAEDIWEYVTDPENWTASNPEEHYGLEYDSPENRPAENVSFHQQEEVAGRYANLYGRFPYIDYPRAAVWVGTAYYPILGGLLTVRIPEGGTLRLEETKKGTRISHSVWMDFPYSWWGSLLRWFFRNVLNGQSRLYDHTMKELRYFKNRLEHEGRSRPVEQ